MRFKKEDEFSKTNLYVIYDTVAEERGPIFEAKNDAVATRQFFNILKESMSPQDFILIRIGKCGKYGQFELINDYNVIETNNIIDEVIVDEKAV